MSTDTARRFALVDISATIEHKDDPRDKYYNVYLRRHPVQIADLWLKHHKNDKNTLMVQRPTWFILCLNECSMIEPKSFLDLRGALIFLSRHRGNCQRARSREKVA